MNNKIINEIELPTLWDKFHKAVASTIHSNDSGGFQGYGETANKCMEIHKDQLTKVFLKAIKDDKFEELKKQPEDFIKIYVNELMENKL